MANEFVEESGFQQVGFLGNERFLGKNDFFGRSRVRRQETPVDEATVPQIGVIGILSSEA